MGKPMSADGLAVIGRLAMSLLGGLDSRSGGNDIELLSRVGHLTLLHKDKGFDIIEACAGLKVLTGSPGI